MAIITTDVKKLIKKSYVKYGNKKTECLSKHNHDSKLEANYCNRLLAMKQNKEIKDFDIQKVFEFVVDGCKVCTHKVDFYVRWNQPMSKEDYYEVHEIKSKATKTPSWSIKHKLFKAVYPSIKYVIIEKH